jgi:hypothetical protein
VWQKSPHEEIIQLLKNYQVGKLVKVDWGSGAANLIKEVVALVVDHYERWEVLNFDLPNSFHS